MPAMPFNALAVVVALTVATWLAFQVIQGLRTGETRAAGFRFSRNAAQVRVAGASPDKDP